MTIRFVFVIDVMAETADSAPRKKSIHTELSTRTLSFSTMLLHLADFLTFGFTPVKIHKTASCQGHELVDSLPTKIIFDSPPNSFRTADPTFETHQLLDQSFIYCNRSSHTNFHYI